MAFPQESITFDKALRASDGTRRHLLMGNGFSIAASYGAFGYTTLMARAFRDDPSLEELFAELRANDFEHAMQLATEPAVVDRLRLAFIQTIVNIHPSRYEILPKWRREYCLKFLQNFLRDKKSPIRGRIFTTNYDFLLCWIAAEYRHEISCWDGFEPSGVWSIGSDTRGALFYLHGALHLYVAPGPKRLETRKRTSAEGRSLSLRDVVSESLSGGAYPLIVSEGSPDEKLLKIQASEYLSHARKALVDACDDTSASLFTLGQRLSDVDHHVRKVIAEGRVQQLYIGVFDRDDEMHAVRLGRSMSKYRERTGLPALSVTTFASRTAPVWGPPELFE